MRKFIASLITIFALVLTGCQNSASKIVNTVDYSQKTGEIGAFKLLTPTDNAELYSIPTFSWEKAENATTYTLEIASSPRFDQIEDAVYIKKSGIITNEFTIGSNLKYKNINYYWRVSALNGDHNKLCTGEMSTFVYKASMGKEIEFSINYADEWTVHELGSQAKISIDNNNFFGNNKRSLAIKFDEEDTNRGEPMSDGWMVITHQQEVEMYGVDAFFFNFYYSGQNSRIFLRVIDEDNEYYNAEIKLANNVKQTIIMRFDEFTLRTKGGTTIANQVFDYNYIKGVEIVFEETFGDGICMVSDLKAVNYEDYKYMFFNKLDFNEVNKEKISYDNYNFLTDFTDDGNSMTLTYQSTANEKNTAGIAGYGFTRVPVGKFMDKGDALRLKIDFEGSKSANILIRLIEEDKDRWVYRQAANAIPEDGYVVIPYNAFTLSQYTGDGNRQFYYLEQIQFGIEGVYNNGTMTFSDVEIVSLKDVIENLHIATVADDGTIDNFEEYTTSAEMYYKWQLSTSNKDEALIINTDMAFGANNKCVKVGYKADMGPANYGLRFGNSVEGYNAISFWAKDDSIKWDNAQVNYLTSVSAKMIITLFVTSGEEYTYTIDALNKYWTDYTISFDSFKLTTAPLSDTVALESGNIVGMMYGLQYYYYTANGRPYPTYANNNFVYFDNFRFDKAKETSQKELATRIMPTPEDANLCYVETFENYSADNLKSAWTMNNNLDYSKLELITENENNYMKMQYKGNSDSVAYGLSTLFADNVVGKAIKLNLYGDGKATVYINIYFTYANVNYKFRAAINNVAEGWHEYTIGFSNFTKLEGTGSLTLASKYVPNISKITFGIVNSVNGELSYVLVDDIRLDGNAKYSANDVIEIGG